MQSVIKFFRSRQNQGDGTPHSRRLAFAWIACLAGALALPGIAHAQGTLRCNEPATGTLAVAALRCRSCAA